MRIALLLFVGPTTLGFGSGDQRETPVLEFFFGKVVREKLFSAQKRVSPAHFP
jgi:hypothetical protein